MVFEGGVDVLAVSVLMPVGGQRDAAREVVVEHVEAVRGRHPDVAEAVFEDVVDAAASERGYAAGVCGRALVDAAVGAHQHAAVAAPHDGGYPPAVYPD